MRSHQQLYNAALEERISAWSKAGKSISYADQCKSLTVLRCDTASARVVLRWALESISGQELAETGVQPPRETPSISVVARTVLRAQHTPAAGAAIDLGGRATSWAALGFGGLCCHSELSLGSSGSVARGNKTLVGRLYRPPTLPITEPHQFATGSVYNEAEQIVDWLQVVHDFFPWVQSGTILKLSAGS